MEIKVPPRPTLSKRQLEVLKLVATGATNQQIARDLVISVNTVKVHLRNIFRRLDVESRTEATLYAIREGWVIPQPAEPPVEARPGPLRLPRARIAAWQRALFVVAALVITLGVALPLPRTASNGTADPFTDRVSGVRGDPSSAGPSRWDSMAQMPTARARLAVVAYDGRIYAIGGDTADGVTGVVEAYDPNTDIWTRLASKPHPVRNIAAAVVGDRIYIPGGYDALDEATATVEVYDPRTDTWHEAAALPTPLFAYAIAAVDDKLYVFGGSNGVSYLSTVYIYDPASDIWTTGTSMSEQRAFCAAAVVDDGVYVLGGYDGQSESDLCAFYAPSKEGSAESPWTPRAALRVGRGGLAAVAVDGQVYAIGGGWTQYLSFNERYDVRLNVWTALDSPLLAQWRTLGAASVTGDEGTVIYAVGGWSDRELSTNYAYKTFFRIYLPGP